MKGRNVCGSFLLMVQFLSLFCLHKLNENIKDNGVYSSIMDWLLPSLFVVYFYALHLSTNSEKA